MASDSAGDDSRGNVEQHWAKLVAQVWADPKLKEQLTSDPARVLRAHGIAVPADADVRVLETTPTLLYLLLPPKPPDVGELSSADLSSVVGGLRKAGGTAVDDGSTSSSGTSSPTSCIACMLF